MPLRRRSKAQGFDLPVGEMVLRITAPLHLQEEARASAMQFWEQLQSYCIRNKAFRTSKRPIHVPRDAPDVCRRMAGISGRVGVGPMFTFQGALTEHVGMTLHKSVQDIVVVNGGDYFVVSRKRAKLTVYQRDGEPLSVVVRPELGPIGVYTTMGRLQLPAETADAVIVVAESCILADAAAAGVMAILRRQNSLPGALGFLQRTPGVHGGIVVSEERIGVAGGLEIAA